MSDPALIAAAFLFLAALALQTYRTAQKRTRLPPGPPRTSIILGNVSDIPRPPGEWTQYKELSKKYGPVLHLRALSRNMIVLDTMRAAVELLEKRGANYSDRPRMPMVGELMGYGWNVSLMRYGSAWRTHRRALHQHLNDAALARLHANFERTNARFLRALVDTPREWWHLTHWLAGANIMSAVYGMEDTKLAGDPWIALGEDTLQMVNEAFVSGFHLVDIFPILKYVPAWLPGAGFKRKALRAHDHSMRARDEPIAWVRAQIEAGKAVPSITTALIDAEVDGAPLPDEVIRNCAGIAYVAGADTTLSTLKSFILAMVRNPGVQRKAQEELDRVLPADRLPVLADRAAFSLPYLEAVMRETYRRYPPVPLGVPHQSLKEDEYEGMRIPAGSVLIANVWSILRDEQTYPDPLAYRPERFLKDGKINEDVMNPRSAVFGFGRRICPGRYFADSEIWLMMATMLFAFDILPARDADGCDIYPTEEVTGALVIAPKQFQCRIVPRSDAKKALVHGTLEAQA
ncbi:cytochrome P450 [Auricularia subglabra TFB-10046 SS5]|nr:cytochrome P450 [Auricularia subglabra TFB-10046 SS5]